MKPMAASSKKWFPAYFYFRFGGKRLPDVVFRHFWPLSYELSLLWSVSVLLDATRHLVTSLPVSPRPEVVSSGQTVAVSSIYFTKVE